MIDSPSPNDSAHAAFVRAISNTKILRSSVQTPDVGAVLLSQAIKYSKASGQMRVLHVEDDAEFRVFLREAARAEAAKDVDFEGARTLREATRLLHSTPHPFDAILLDLNLPDSNGVNTLELVRRVDAVTPVVVLSGAEIPLEVCYGRGAVSVLRKPVALSPILNALAKAITSKALPKDAKP